MHIFGLIMLVIFTIVWIACIVMAFKSAWKGYIATDPLVELIHEKDMWMWMYFMWCAWAIIDVADKLLLT